MAVFSFRALERERVRTRKKCLQKEFATSVDSQDRFLVKRKYLSLFTSTSTSTSTVGKSSLVGADIEKEWSTKWEKKL